MRCGIPLVVCALVAQVTVLSARAEDKAKPSPKWSLRATAIEACSCPMFCPCYFDTKPAAHAVKDAHAGHGSHAGHGASGGGGASTHAGQEHFCRFNMAYKVDSGQHGDTRLDGAKFWISGDLGDGWADGKAEWAVLTFDPAVTPQQREGLKAALAGVFPVKWDRFVVGPDKTIDWEASKDRAHAKLDGGKAAEVALQRNPYGNTAQPTVISNLKYWGAPRNEGFVLMPNDVNAMRQAPDGIKPFEFRNSNGFMITWDINSEDVAARERK